MAQVGLQVRSAQMWGTPLGHRVEHPRSRRFVPPDQFSGASQKHLSRGHGVETVERLASMDQDGCGCLPPLPMCLLGCLRHNQYLDGVGKLRTNVNRTGWFDDLLQRVGEPGDPTDAAPRASGEAGSLYNSCRALEPHPDWLYTTFRPLSAYAHPSGVVVQMFVPGTADQAPRSHQPQPPSSLRANSTPRHPFSRPSPEGRQMLGVAPST
jgi:hypothetical protein